MSLGIEMVANSHLGSTGSRSSTSRRQGPVPRGAGVGRSFIARAPFWSGPAVAFTRTAWTAVSGTTVTVVRCTYDIHGYRSMKHADQHQLALIMWQMTSAQGSR